jgi:hypothetical protein
MNKLLTQPRGDLQPNMQFWHEVTTADQSNQSPIVTQIGFDAVAH